MPLLYYWRPDNYRRDRVFGFGYHLNQNSPAMAAARPGDSRWAFTRRTRDGIYVLAAELIVRALTRNPPHYRYGAFRLWGDLERGRYFDTEIGPNAEPVLRRLSISARAQHLGQAFQGHAAVRQLSEADHRVLAAVSASLPVLERAGIYPEDELEAQLVMGERVQSFVISGGRLEHARRLAYLYETVDVHRARGLVEHLQRLYAGRCQLCLYECLKPLRESSSNVLIRHTRPVSLRADGFPDVDELVAELREALDGSGEAVGSFHASWDGDTTGWMIWFEARSRAGSVIRAFGIRGAGGDLRLFNGAVPPWPEVPYAEELGHRLAAIYGVPFVFERGSGPMGT